MENPRIIHRGPYKYVEAGEGEPLIVLHGLFGALSNFQGVFDYFSSHFRVIIPMLPIYDMPMLKTSAKNLSEQIKLHDGAEKPVKHGGAEKPLEQAKLRSFGEKSSEQTKFIPWWGRETGGADSNVYSLAE